MKHAIRTSERYRWYALGAVMLGTIMSPLDGSIANIAVPAIGRAFGHSVDDVEWVLLSYVLVTASTLVLFGRLGDMIGQKRIYLSGFAIFGLSSLVCAFAPSLWWLVAARCVQGIGAAMLMSCSPAIITNAFPGSERGRAIGMNGAAVAVGLTSGPVLGGLLVTYASWRWIFMINVPISIVAFAVAALVLRHEEGKHERFDIPGALCASSALLALSLALSRAHVWGWHSPATLTLLLYAVAAIAMFVRIEMHAPSPMIDLRLFENRTFAFSVAAATLYFCATFSVVFAIPLAAQIALGANALQAGATLLPISALSIVLAPIAGALSDRVPARYVSTAGSLCFALGALLLALLPDHPAKLAIALCVVVAGLGTAVFSQPNNSTIMGSAPANRRGVAAGILATARTTGQLLGIAIAGAVYFLRSQQLGALAHGFGPAKSVFWMVCALMLLVSIVSYSRD